MRNAHEVLVATYCFDHRELTTMLERRLRGHAVFDVSILVDREQVQERVLHYQRTRLASLRRLGASVTLCHGGRM